MKYVWHVLIGFMLLGGLCGFGGIFMSLPPRGPFDEKKIMLPGDVSAYDQGKEAAKLGLPETINPHVGVRETRSWYWKRGWVDGLIELKRKKE